jgi:hypothetical protein
MSVKVKFEAVAVDSVLHRVVALDTNGEIWTRGLLNDNSWVKMEAPESDIHPGYNPAPRRTPEPTRPPESTW